MSEACCHGDAVVTLGQSEKLRFDKAFLAQLDSKEVDGGFQEAVNFDAMFFSAGRSPSPGSARRVS